MKKKIFSSQGNFDLARDRHHRRLEARLDKIPEQKEPQGKCKHYDYCNVKQFGNQDCLIKFKFCQTYKFYEKYGEQGNQLGVGS